ncbi:MAG: YggT family protein [Candidatus Aminicenantales bacterium]
MILVGNFLSAVAKMLNIVLVIYMWIVIIRAILSWINIPSLYEVNVILYRVTEPVLRPIRKIVPPHRMGGIDISPIILVLIIIFINSFFVKSLAIYARELLEGFRKNF